MVGIELKFRVPPAHIAAVRHALITATTRSGRLHTRYFDTPDRRLTGAGLVLRLQREAGQWTQNLEGPRDGLLPPLQHHFPVAAQRAPVELDVARHASTPLGEALAAALGDQAHALGVVFEADLRRASRVVRSAGARVEVSLDVGRIHAGDAQRSECELLFKLQSGPAAGLVGLAARWIERYSLWFDVRHAAERGDCLARGVNAGPPVQARAPVLKDDMHADAALRAIVAACMAQILPNAAEVSDNVAGAEHLHQLRVGLRRLRAALRVFGDWSAEVGPAWDGALADVFARLGTARDRDAIAAALLPELKAAGAPFIELPADISSDDPGEVLRSAQCGKLMLELIAFAHGTAPPEAGPLDAQQETLITLVRPRLKRMQRQIAADAEGFQSLDDTMQHRTRKRLKRLRYCAEFVASLYGAKPVRRYLRRLRRAQNLLGLNNDLIVAEIAFRHQLETDARAWFALGYFAARRTQTLQDAALALKSLAKSPGFWS